MSMLDSISAARISGPHSTTDGSHIFEFRFSTSDPLFAGHFPLRPLLPGVFQLEITRFAAELVLNRSLDVQEITKAKFLRPIIPDETVRVELKLSEKADMIQLRANFSVTGQAAGETILQVTQKS